MAESVLAEIVHRKRSDVAARLSETSLDPRPTRRSLRRALAKPGARFIMEVKKRSPSGHRSEIGVAAAVEAYASVSDAISVLTDEPFFGGSFEDLRTARAGFGGPILAKDFVIDPRQVAEARLHGADAILAMMSVLDDGAAQGVMAEARRLSMDVIVEVHDERELGRALALGADIIGINNRDLRTLKTDLAVTEQLADLVPENVIVVSESGIRSRVDVERLSGRADAFLAGSSLMASGDIALAARSLAHGPVKICGLTRVEDVLAAAKAGTTHAGFILVPGTPRAIDPCQAIELVALARRSRMKTVGVFRDAAEESVLATAERLNLDAIQLHGRETPGFTSMLRSRMPQDMELWGLCDVGAAASPGRPGIDRTLFDTLRAGASGGTGRAFCWELLRGRDDLPTSFLAGGIGPANARAAQRVGTFGIDVGSGVERAPGQKDHGKLQALFDALRPSSRGDLSCA